MVPIIVIALVTTAAWSETRAEEVFGARRTLSGPEIKRAVAAAPGGRTPGTRLCDLHVYSRDTSPTNLRAGPSPAATAVATLPGIRKEAGTEIGPEFQVIGGKDEWFLIRGAHWAGYDLPEKALVLGPAWMAANLTRFEIWAPGLLREPREAAPVEVSLRSPGDGGTSWGPDSVKVERVHGCSGSYVDVAVVLPDGRKARGWATGLCGNQVTTCGGYGNPLEERKGGLYRSPRSCEISSPDDPDCPPGG